jgi:hypothetical protein
MSSAVVCDEVTRDVLLMARAGVPSAAVAVEAWPDQDGRRTLTSE